MFTKISNMKDHKDFYNNWCYEIDKTYNRTLRFFDDIYNLKYQLDEELSFIYVEKLIDYYSYLKRLDLAYNVSIKEQTDQQRKNNYDVIQDEVDKLLIKYIELINFILAVKDLEGYREFGLPEEVLCFDKYI